MTWILEGKRVRATYLVDMPLTGVVLESRVKYGGAVQHRIKLDVPLAMRWRTEPADILLVDDDKIMEVLLD
jgi:hypothetical protein